jgi:glycyl-tRNA synthetase beta chain
MAQTKNLLVELFVEELPPKALQRLGAAFAEALAADLRAQGVADNASKATAYATPRRLALHLTHVAAKAADRAVRTKLMPVKVGLDAKGQPTPPLLKKLQALGQDAAIVPRLARALDGKNETLFYEHVAAGKTLQEALQHALSNAIAKLPIPKMMTYQLHRGTALPGWDSVQFVRPAHGLVALHGAEVVAVTALGLSAGRTTHGHRFEAERDPIELADADAYAETLRREGAVIASFAERRALIARQLSEVAARAGGGLQAIADAALLDEVTALVERPNALACQFEREFLGVPQECLILTMKANQKYFPLLDAAGKLTHQFIVVSNITPADPSAIVAGNERVVRPRLADAKFFYDQDRKQPLASRVPGLAKVVYHNELGTQAERSERVRASARAIASMLGDDALVRQADQAAQLAKADLLTGMVGEFPELQGTMGRYYALHDGLPAAVADAIEDHYKPRFSGDTLPRGAVGTVVALADKLETLVGLFGIGALPTGEKDPFALRRHALGVVRMLVEQTLPLPLSTLLDAAWPEDGQIAVSGAPGGHRRFDPQNRALVRAFIQERLAGYLRDLGFSAQEVDAVLALNPDRLDRIGAQLGAVRAFAQLPEAPALAAANKRIANILKKSAAASADAAPAVDPALLREPAEQALNTAMQAVLPRAHAQFEAGDYTASLQTLAALRAPVDAFFDGVMVNAEDAALQTNRLHLLEQLHRAMNRVADLARLAA